MAIPYTIPLQGGGSVTTNANSYQAALDNVKSGGNTPAGSGGTSGGGPTGSSGGGQQQQNSGGGNNGGGGVTQGQLDASLQKMLAALATGNAQAFQESKDEFNKTYQLKMADYTGQINGNPTVAVQQFNADLAQKASQFAQTFGLSQQGQALTNAANVAQLTGYYQTPGAPASGDLGAAAAKWQADQTRAGNNVHTEQFTAQPSNVQAQYGYTPAGAGGPAGPTLAAQQQQAQLSGQYNGAPTEQARQFNQQQQQASDQFAQTFGLNQAGVTGQYNGAPTEQARQFNQQQGQQNNQFNASLAQQLLQAATQLRGPNDYLQYQMQTHGGQSLLSQLYGNGQAGATAVPAGQLQSANLNSAIGDLGAQRALSGTGATIPQSGAQAGGQPDPTASALLASFGLTPGGTLNPGQIDPARWDAIGQTGQALTKNLASTYFGYDPTDFENQVNAARPVGTSTRNTTSTFAPASAQGLF